MHTNPSKKITFSPTTHEPLDPEKQIGGDGGLACDPLDSLFITNDLAGFAKVHYVGGHWAGAKYVPGPSLLCKRVA